MMLNSIFRNSKLFTKTDCSGRVYCNSRRRYSKFQAKRLDDNQLCPKTMDKNVEMPFCLKREDSERPVRGRLASFNFSHISLVVARTPKRFMRRPRTEGLVVYRPSRKQAKGDKLETLNNGDCQIRHKNNQARQPRGCRVRTVKRLPAPKSSRSRVALS